MRTRIALLLTILLLICACGYRPLLRLDPPSLDFYHLARHFMTRNEERVFLHLATAELRQEFIDAFWEIRNPNPGSNENEFRNQIEERFEFINSYFREANRPGWDTARGMVYLLLGPPESQNQISTLNDPDFSGYIRWYYGESGFYVQFVDEEGFGVYHLDMNNTPLRLLDYLEMAKNFLLTVSEKDIGSRYLNFQISIDPTNDRLRLSIKAKDLYFESGTDDKQTIRLHLGFSLYLPDGTIVSRSEERKIAADENVLNEGRLQLNVEIPLKPGHNHVDLLVIDRNSGKMNRKLFSVKKK